MARGRPLLIVVTVALLVAACSSGEISPTRQATTSDTTNGSPSATTAPATENRPHEPAWPKVARGSKLLPQSIWFLDARLGFGSSRSCSRVYKTGRFFAVKCTLVA